MRQKILHVRNRPFEIKNNAIIQRNKTQHCYQEKGKLVKQIHPVYSVFSIIVIKGSLIKRKQDKGK